MIKKIEKELNIIKMRMTAVKALKDSGQGLEEELEQIKVQLKNLKQQPDLQNIYINQIDGYLNYIEKAVKDLVDRRVEHKLDFQEISEAKNAIRENPEILKYTPNEALINHEPQEIKSKTNEIINNLSTMAQEMQKVFEALQDRIERAIKVIADFIKTPKFEELQEIFTDLEQWIDTENPEINIDLFWLQYLFENIDELLPFIEEEINNKKREQGIKNISLEEFLNNEDPTTGKNKKSLFEICIDKANKIREARGGKGDFNSRTLCSEIEQIEAAYPALKSLLPNRHTMANNALMNILQQKQAINAGEFDLVVANPRGRRKEITSYTMITYDQETAGIALTANNLSEYERQVSDAIITLWLEAQKQEIPPVFTTDMIFRTMPGGGDKPSPQQRGAITKTIEKLRHLHITVDATEEMRLRGAICKNEVYEFDDFYLSALRVKRRVKNGGQIVTAYKINSEPLILTYSRMTKQLLEVNSKYIEVRKVKKGKTAELISMTAGRQAMTGYMLRRVLVMKRDKKNKIQTQSNVILFDTLFTESGTATKNREIARRNRDFCFEVLEYWKATGLIKDYQQQIKGKNITGVIIDT